MLQFPLILTRPFMSTGVLSKSMQCGLRVKLPKNKIPELSADIPTKPKKPITAWIMFLRERKHDYQSGMNATQMAAILSKEWQQIDKSRYEEVYKQKYDEWKKANQEYKDSLTDEHRKMIKAHRASVNEVKAQKQLFKTRIPRLPRNAANFFCQVRSKQQDVIDDLKQRKSTQVYKDLFEEWRQLSAEEKKRYAAMQEEDKMRFSREFNQWYETIQDDETINHVARDFAEKMRGKLLALNYI